MHFKCIVIIVEINTTSELTVQSCTFINNNIIIIMHEEVKIYLIVKLFKYSYSVNYKYL